MFRHMKLLLENWREYLNEQVSATATEVETFTATEVETLVRDHHHNEDDLVLKSLLLWL